MRCIKRTNLRLFSTTIFFLAIGLVFFKYKINIEHTKVNKSFENALVIADKVNTDKTINIEIAGKMVQGDGVKSCKSITKLSGTILIGNKRYELRGAKCSKSGNNTFTCIVNDDNSSCNNKYTCYISEDLNSIVLESPNGSESIVSPASNVAEALILKSKLLGDK